MSATAPRVKPIRRIVTGHDAQGRSAILSDGPSPHVMTLAGVDNFGMTDLWKTFGTPADNGGGPESCGPPITLAPPPGGTVFRIVEFPPDADYIDRWDRSKAFASLGESGAESMDSSGTRHEMMHRTATVDYAFVMKGEIWAIMDTGETLMTAGDVLVQRGTNHAWSNRSDAPCWVGFVLVDARPLALPG
jgi:hypothetical protein